MPRCGHEYFVRVAPGTAVQSTRIRVGLVAARSCVWLGEGVLRRRADERKNAGHQTDGLGMTFIDVQSFFQSCRQTHQAARFWCLRGLGVPPGARSTESVAQLKRNCATPSMSCHFRYPVYRPAAPGLQRVPHWGRCRPAIQAPSNPGDIVRARCRPCHANRRPDRRRRRARPQRGHSRRRQGGVQRWDRGRRPRRQL